MRRERARSCSVPSLPAGLTLHAVGLSLDLAKLAFGDISDVLRIDL